MAALDAPDGEVVKRRYPALLVLCLVIGGGALFAQDAFPSPNASPPVDATSPISTQMMFLMGAGFLVTALTGVIKKFGGASLDGTAAQRGVAIAMTFILFALVKVTHLAPDLTSSIWSVIAFLVTSYGLSAGTYVHAKDLKPPDPSQLSAPH